MNDESPGASPSEEARLLALDAYAIVDTAREDEFDEIVSLAARLCRMPIAAITLVDARRQWFKARIGLDISETPRDIAFCAHTVNGRAPLVVPDAHNDARFADNPLVTGAPHLRFYAGFPLTTPDGCVVGSLAVMDRVPAALDADQMHALQVLSHQVVTRLELRRSLQLLAQSRAELLRANTALEHDIQQRLLELGQTSAAHVRAEQLYRTLWETTTDAVVILDDDSILRYANPAVEQVFGHAPGQLVGQSLAVLQPERMRASHQHGLRRYLATGCKRLDWRAAAALGLHANGSEIPIEIAFSEIHLAGEHLFVGFIRDVTERRRIEEALIQEKERAQTILRSVGDAVVSIDAAGNVSFLNPMAERLTGWTHAQALGHAFAEVLPLRNEMTGFAVRPALHVDPSADVPFNVLPANTVLACGNGEPVAVEGSIARVCAQPGQVSGWVLALRDVSQSRRMMAQISYQASHDALTGLVNRTEFDRLLAVALDSAAKGQRTHSVLYMDLDQFKVVNDTCGHVAGDELLRQLSSLLALSLRRGDVLARLGGDEFGVLLENCDAPSALRIAEKLRQAVVEFAFGWNERVFATSVSIGLVSFEDATLTLSDVLSKADEACYVAKDKGRNRIHIYHAGDHAQALRHGEMEWVGLIHEALEEERMVLYAQSIFPVQGNAASRPIHVEILLRMRDRDGNIVPPMAFIPAAERYNLMPVIDRWVVRAVLKRIAGHIATDGETGERCYAINLSGASLGDPDFAKYIHDQLLDSGVPPAWICFEITETAAIANLSSAVRFIHDVRQAGCHFALDDFGSGMSSFNYLKHLPVDVLKIDGSFVVDIEQDLVDRAMVGSINEIAHIMGLKTIAEFVESDAILQQLKAIGVDYAQGFGLARPVPFP